VIEMIHVPSVRWSNVFPPEENGLQPCDLGDRLIYLSPQEVEAQFIQPFCSEWEWSEMPQEERRLRVKMSR